MSSRLCSPSACGAPPPSWLVIALLALPQIAETILAPALPDLARHWRLDAAATQPVMGVFFVGFAAGVFLWGHLADTWGRRPAMLAGLATGLAGTLGALAAPHYAALLGGRFVQALGLAACSVVTQTALRDCLDGPRLTRTFVTLGAVLAWSPAVGPLTGQLLADRHGYAGVLATLAVVIALLLGSVAWRWHETRPARTGHVPLAALAGQMLADAALRLAVLRVAGLNLLVFSFYAAGPFMTGPLPGLGFGWVGLGVALVGSLGAAANRRLPAAADAERRVRYGLRCVALGTAAQAAAMAWRPEPGWLWAAAALPVFAGYGLAIPNLLGPALRRYGHCLGRAGALFGLAYYSLLGLGLAATSWLPFDTPRPLSLAWLGLALALLLARSKPA
ncbi:MAG: multidrug effflux MFS transporter [Achromobacter sp.]|jgi:MFS family permease|uniref:Inner membrane transport protein YdhC n=2 Tax=Achromobacter TaxID=222 RepID=A0A6J5ALM4_9BURK|nr:MULTISPECIES: multidrug effflux MFS transporter [Achromobacter]MBN9639388.1 multidrug effflux MFS transporter [Achromobacter sp.]MCG2599000.1 multidrug effflux MFS transporter [Achromobacter sp.]MCG2606114.1 multidrug effflux MFS transporter [Achromobacter sp.]CAB3650850.1 Inner membrane transport protein YdhC [Achromobacter insuavis]CUI45253.1 Inner membrane transport protein ydhC [Achromobacter sp. 2789STDY5608628]